MIPVEPGVAVMMGDMPLRTLAAFGLTALDLAGYEALLLQAAGKEDATWL